MSFFGEIGKIFGGGKTKGAVQTQRQSNVPEWVERESEPLYQKFKDTYFKPNRIYNGPKVAEFSGLQNKAFENIGNTNRLEKPLQELGAEFRNQANKPNERISTSKFTDPNSGFNKYVEETFDPYRKQLQQLQGDEARRESNRLSMSGYRTGGTASERSKNRLSDRHEEQMKRALSHARNEANQFFQSDQGRALQAAEANQAAELKNRQLANQNLTSALNTLFGQHNIGQSEIMNLLTGGQLQQTNAQDVINEHRKTVNEIENFDRTELQALLDFLNGNPGGTTTSTHVGPGQNKALQYLNVAKNLFG
jgi:hypothetical protein